MSHPYESVPPRAEDNKAEDGLDFTGERVIPGKVDADLFNEHFARYLYARQVCSGRDVLDTGCGTGYGSACLAETASRVIGFDRDAAAIRYARRHHSMANAEYVVADCSNFPFAAHTFDIVTSFELIEHLQDANAYLAEIRRVLRRDGSFLVSTPNRPIYAERRGGAANPFHVREWDLEEFLSLLKEYFGAVQILGQAHVAAIGILSSGVETTAIVQGQASPEKADYLVCLCSNVQRPAGGMVFVPSSANVLGERERHIRALTEDVRLRDTHLARLQSELEEKAAWANTLNLELGRLQSETARLRLEAQELGIAWSKATRWKRALIFGISAPLNWLVGGCVIGAALLGRILRRSLPRTAPMKAVADPTRCSIIIVTWEGKELLAESLPAVLRAVHVQGGDHEIIVVDNGSTDGSSEYIRAEFPQVRLIRSERNLYFGGGNNLGVSQAKHDIVILLNNDMIVHEDFLAPLLEPFRAPDVFAVGSQVFLANPQKRREETGKTCATFNGCDLDWKHEPIFLSDEQQRYLPVFWGHGGAVAMDQHKFRWLGGFDPLFDPFYVEDADISYSAWKAGWQCLLAVPSKVIHKHRSSTSRFGGQFINQIVRRNQYLFFWKQFSDLDKLLAHFWRSPRQRMRRAGVPGIGIRVELLAFLGAAERLPAVLRGKLRRMQSQVRNDQTILNHVQDPQIDAVRSPYLDFTTSPCSEQLGTGWHEHEISEGRGYRWMAQRAAAYLCAPAGPCELSIHGHLPPLSAYGASTIILTACCQGEWRQVRLEEGEFECHWPAPAMLPGSPVEVTLAVNRTMQSAGDARNLGVIVRGLGFTTAPGMVADGERQGIHRSISLRGRPKSEIAASGQRRVLMICAYLPCPGSGGGNLMFNLIRTLSRRHRLTVLSFYEQDAELDQAPKLAQYCENLEVIYRAQSFDAPDPLGLKPPEMIYEFYQRNMEQVVRKYVSREPFDVIQCEFLQTAHFANVAPEIPAVLTNHEVLSMAYKKRLQRTPWFSGGKLKALVAWMRMLNYETDMVRRFAAVVVLTKPEADFFARYAVGVPVYQHAMGVDCDYFCPRDGHGEPQTVAFVGNFRHSPNVSGALWFVEKVWPQVRRRYPAARLYLVGPNAPPTVHRWNAAAGITVTGQVGDVRPYLERSEVVVAPVFEGAGMRTKVLEAWAMGRAVVGTRLAFEGISAEASICPIADDAEEFAARVCDLLDHQELAKRIGKQARQVALTSFSWEVFAEMYSRIYEQISRAGGRGSAESTAGRPAQATI